MFAIQTRNHLFNDNNTFHIIFDNESEYENLARIKNDPVSLPVHPINNNNNNLII